MKLLNNIIATIIIVFLTAGAIYAVETRHLPTLKMPKVQIPKLALKTDFFKQKPTVVLNPSIIPTILPAVKSTPTPTPWKYQLQRKGDKKTEISKSFDPGQRFDIYRFEDYLFYVDNTRQFLIKENLNTGKKAIIFDANTTSIDSLSIRSFNPQVGIFSLETREDILLFSVSVSTDNFEQVGATYVLNMKNDEIPHRIADFPGILEKIQGRDFLVREHGGDVCGGRKLYATIDFATLKVMKIVETATGCFSGEHFIGLDSKERLITAYTNTNSSPGSPFYIDTVAYESISAIPLNNPENTEGVIAKQNMPEAITDIKYLNYSNDLLLVGKSVYIFNFDKNEVKKISDLPSNWKNTLIELNADNSICIVYPNSIKTQKSNNEYFYDKAELKLSENKIKENNQVCPNKITKNEYQPTNAITFDNLKKLIEEMNLPGNYELVSSF